MSRASISAAELLTLTHDPKAVSLLDGVVPWQIVKGYEDQAGVLDANGRTLFIAPGHIARRVVAAVNMVECAYRDVRRRSLCGND